MKFEIDLEKAIRKATTISSEAKKGWNGKKKTNKKSIKSSPKKKRKPPMTTQQKNESLGNMGMKPLGYWAKKFERFID